MATPSPGGSRTRAATSWSSKKGHSTRRCTAWNAKGGSRRSGGNPSLAARQSSTASPRTAANNSAPKPKSGRGLLAPCRGFCCPPNGQRSIPRVPRPGTFGRQLRSLIWKASVADEVDAELAFHVEMRTREYIARGLDPELARATAIGRFGDLQRINATCRRIGEGRERDMRRAEWIHELAQDARYAVRQLGRMPGFTLVAALTLAIGIGATTAIFSVVHAVVLQPLPFPEPEQLVRVYATRRDVDGSASAAAFVAWRERSRSFSAL